MCQIVVASVLVPEISTWFVWIWNKLDVRLIESFSRWKIDDYVRFSLLVLSFQWNPSALAFDVRGHDIQIDAHSIPANPGIMQMTATASSSRWVSAYLFMMSLDPFLWTKRMPTWTDGQEIDAVDLRPNGQPYTWRPTSDVRPNTIYELRSMWLRVCLVPKIDRILSHVIINYT